MTEKQKIIFKKMIEMYEHTHQLISPTRLGIVLGIEYFNAATYCSSPIEHPIEERMIERVGKGLYKPIIFLDKLTKSFFKLDDRVIWLNKKCKGSVIASNIDGVTVKWDDEQIVKFTRDSIDELKKV